MRFRIARITITGLALSAFLSSLTPAQAAPKGEPLELSVEEAIARALEQNEGILIQRRGVDAAAAATQAARGAYDPVLSLEGGWRQRSQPVNSAFSGAPEGELAPTDEFLDAGITLSRLLPTGGEAEVHLFGSRSETDGTFAFLSPAFDSQLGVELRQPLLQDRAIDPVRLELRVAATGKARATATLHREVAQTVTDVAQAYWHLAAAERRVQVQRESVELAQDQLEETRIRIQGGVAPESELAQPRAELERRRGELLKAKENLVRAQNALKLLILGDDQITLWSRPVVASERARVDPEAVQVAAAVQQALTARPELAAASALVARREAEAVFARNRTRPELDLVVSYDRYGLAGSLNAVAPEIPGLPGTVPPQLERDWQDAFDMLADEEFDDTRVALVLAMPMRNRTARANAEIARTTVRQAELALARSRKVVRAEVLNAAAALETALGRIAATRAAREAAQVQLAAEQERFAVGLSTNFLVLTRQNDLAAARLAEIQARTDYRTARVQMARVTGTLLASRGIQLLETQERED